MRLLHARHRRDHGSVACRKSRSDRSGDPRRAVRQSVPLHRLPQHRRGDRRRPRPGGARAARHERNAHHRQGAAAPRGLSLRHRTGPLSRRYRGAGCPARAFRSLAARACADPLDRHRSRAPGRGRRRHRRRARTRAMDHVVAHGAADRGLAPGRVFDAADRQGPLHRRSRAVHRRAGPLPRGGRRRAREHRL